jgi:hypothetical protein
MHGPSYAGGIELVSAGIDHRIDAIAPAIAWHSLLTAALPRRPRQERLGRGPLRPGPADRHAARRDRPARRADGHARPAHHVRARLRARDGALLRRGQAVVRRPGAGGARGADPRADAAHPGHCRHALHAVGGDPRPDARRRARRTRRRRSPLALDGQPHTISRALEGVAASASSGSRYVLQITGGTTMYGPVRTAGMVGFSAITLTLSAAAAGSSSAALAARHRGRLHLHAHLPHQAQPQVRARAGLRRRQVASRSAAATAASPRGSTSAGARREGSRSASPAAP